MSVVRELLAGWPCHKQAVDAGGMNKYAPPGLPPAGFFVLEIARSVRTAGEGERHQEAFVRDLPIGRGERK
jgi:hypothetical protein